MIQLNIKIRKCALCKSLIKDRRQSIIGEGDIKSPLMIIGRNPGKDEDLQNRVFVGRAGKELNRWLAELDVNRSKIYITNIVKCHTKDDRRPKSEEIENCGKFLSREMDIVKPILVIALGEDVTKGLTTQSNIPHGELLESEYDDGDTFMLIPFLHPSAALRNERLRTLAYQDLKVLKDYLISTGIFGFIH